MQPRFLAPERRGSRGKRVLMALAKTMLDEKMMQGRTRPRMIQLLGWNIPMSRVTRTLQAHPPRELFPSCEATTIGTIWSGADLTGRRENSAKT